MKTHTAKWKILGACREGLDFAETCESNAEVWEKCPRGDWLIWMLNITKRLTQRDAVELSVTFAQRVQPIFTAKYPDDKRPQSAIDEAQKWLADPSKASQNATHAAASAYASADTAYADASYASTDAAYAAANAAAHAAASIIHAAAAVYAANAAAIPYATEHLWQADFIRTKFGPWKD